MYDVKNIMKKNEKNSKKFFLAPLLFFLSSFDIFSINFNLFQISYI